MIPDPLQITLGGLEISVPPLQLGQIRRIKNAIKADKKRSAAAATEGELLEGLDVIDTGIEILCIALGKKEDEVAGTVPEINTAAQEILKFAGFVAEGEIPGAPVKTQTSDGGLSTGG